MKEKTYAMIPVLFNTKNTFKQLQLDYAKKGIRKTEDELVNILINTNKEFNKIIPKYSKALEEVHALTSELEKAQLTIQEITRNKYNAK